VVRDRVSNQGQEVEQVGEVRVSDMARMQRPSSSGDPGRSARPQDASDVRDEESYCMIAGEAGHGSGFDGIKRAKPSRPAGS
jgi:hypothetical protein